MAVYRPTGRFVVSHLVLALFWLFLGSLYLATLD